MKNASIWNGILASASKNLDPAEIEKWLRPLELSELRGDVVTISAPNRFFKTWVEDKYIGVLKEALKDNLFKADDIKIIVKNAVPASKPVHQPSAPAAKEESKDVYGMPLDKMMTFENFVTGASNSFAYSACVAAAKGFNTLYNPLYIYGDVGLGKTHLMQAVGNELKENFPKLKIIYTTGETFMNEFITALRQKKQEDFKAKYQDADVLLFDDIQALAGETRQKTSEEFFFTFSFLYANQKRIILTSNAAPNEIPDLDKRLTSRFSAGLMVDVQPPSVEEREAIIFKRFEMLRTEVKPDVVRFLAENVKSRNVRPIIGVITTLHTMAELQQTEITVEFAQSVVKTYLSKRDKVLSPDEIILITASYFHLKPIDLKSKTRANSIAYPRSVAMYLLRQKTSLSLNDIGSLFGRDHSTVMAAVKKITLRLETDEELKGTVADLSKQMKMNK